jgi:ribosomal protein L4
LALKSAFTEKMLANNISYFVTDGALDFKSKNFTKLLESAKLNSTRRILFILDKENASDKAVARSIKNMKNVSVKCINSVSVNDIVLASHVLINENAAEQLGKRGE